MVNESVILNYWKGVFAGFVVIYITVCASVASTLYNYSTSLSNTDILKDAVILLFLNDIDEKVYLLIETLYPSWISHLKKEISDYLNEMKSKIKLRYGDAVSFQLNAAEDKEDIHVTIQNDEDEDEDEEQRRNSALEPCLEGHELLSELDFERAYHELESKIVALEKDHVEANKLRATENSNMAKMFQHEISMTKKCHSQEMTEMKNMHNKEINEMKIAFVKEVHKAKKIHETDVDRQVQLEKEVSDLKKLLLSLEKKVQDLK